MGESPFNPPIGSFGWPTPDPRMFIPPWYQQSIVQHVLERATKLPYMKLQYLTYVEKIQMLVFKYPRRPLKLMVK